MGTEERRIGLLVNPKAGCGVESNTPGSDLIEYFEPATSQTVRTAIEFLRDIKGEDLVFITAEKYMGQVSLEKAGITEFRIIQENDGNTSREDTVEFVKSLNETNPEIVVFFGGDGTAADICSVLRDDIPVIGVPAGVKMHSSVFAISPQHALDTLGDFLAGGVDTEMADVVDVDEESMLKGIYQLDIKGSLRVPVSRHIILSSKREYESTDVMGAVEYVLEKMSDDTSYIIGSGSTCKIILRELGFVTSFYGIDILKNGKLVAENADRKLLREYVKENKSVLILTPIGGQGFLIGRGNRQIDDSILSHLDPENLIVISSIEKISDLKCLILESEVFKPDYIRVLYDYGRFRVIKVER